jgi:ABC-type glutathione transport system ATPase component
MAEDAQLTAPVLELKNVQIFQEQTLVLSDVDLEVHRGEFVYLIGKTGSGKSSLLKDAVWRPPAEVRGAGIVVGFDLDQAHLEEIACPEAKARYRVPGLQPAERPHREREPCICAEGYRMEGQRQHTDTD